MNERYRGTQQGLEPVSDLKDWVLAALLLALPALAAFFLLLPDDSDYGRTPPPVPPEYTGPLVGPNNRFSTDLNSRFSPLTELARTAPSVNSNPPVSIAESLVRTSTGVGQTGAVSPLAGALTLPSSPSPGLFEPRLRLLSPMAPAIASRLRSVPGTGGTADKPAPGEEPQTAEQNTPQYAERDTDELTGLPTPAEYRRRMVIGPRDFSSEPAYTLPDYVSMYRSSHNPRTTTKPSAGMTAAERRSAEIVSGYGSILGNRPEQPMNRTGTDAVNPWGNPSPELSGSTGTLDANSLAPTHY